MIIINDMPGQLCNRLWSFAPYIAQSIESSNKVIVPYFGEYYKKFDDLKKIKGVYFVPFDNGANFRFWRFAFKIFGISPNFFQKIFRIYIDRKRWGEEQWESDIIADPRNIVVLSAWNNPRPAVDLSFYRQPIADLFRPTNSSCDKVDQLICRARIGVDVLVGIHIRRRDFREFVGGRYFFEFDEYFDTMKGLLRELSPKSVRFLLCSDEALPLSSFPGIDIIWIPDATDVEDLYGLSQVDFLVAGPSTFAMWASFTGNVPMRVLENHGEPISLDQFSPSTGLYEFSDGHRFEFEDKSFEYLNVYNTSP